MNLILRWPHWSQKGFVIAFALLYVLTGCSGGSMAGSGQTASTLWTVADAQSEFHDFNDAFYYNITGSEYGYRVDEGSANAASFWISANEIATAVDAYQNLGGSTYRQVVSQLVNGFNEAHPAWWNGSDEYDDDMMWATLAFISAYQAVGTSAWLSDAEDAYQTVYSRGLATGGGIYWDAEGCPSNCSNSYENSAANWTFVIAGIMLYKQTGNTTYLKEANAVYSWAYSNLYDSSTGEVYDASTSKNQYSYNYGVAIGAYSLRGDPSDATLAAKYMMSDLPNYAGTYNGYFILPEYDNSEDGSDGGGFNGIALRWTAYAYRNGAISDKSVLSWMQVNVEQGWLENNSAGLSWNNWESPTPGSGLYSWDCTDTVVGMLDVPLQ